VFGVTAEPSSLGLDEIREAQSVDDNLQPVIQALVEGVKPPQGNLRDYLEEARVLISQWHSLVLEDSVLYRRYHYPDCTTRYLQVVLPAKLRHPYVERLHAALGHFGRAKSCMVRTSQTSVLPRMALTHWNASVHLPYLQSASEEPSVTATG